jgi:hypothetical protein
VLVEEWVLVFLVAQIEIKDIEKVDNGKTYG